MDPRNYIIAGLLVALAGAGLVTAHYMRAYYEFVATTEANGKTALAEKARTEKDWKQKLKDAEDRYEQDRARNAAGFAAELARLRAQNTPSRRVRQAAPPIGVCADASGNNRLSDALQSYRAGERGRLEETLRVFETCQLTTDTLIACQADLMTLTR